MKTRKKTVKTPTNGRRRSSVIVVKKSPIRRNQRRNLKIPNKYSIITNYESPLRSLKDNGLVKPSISPKPSTSSTPPVKAGCMKKEQVKEMNDDKKPICLPTATKCNPADSKIIKQEVVVKDDSEQNDNTQDIMNKNITRPKFISQKRSTPSSTATRDKPYLKKRKLKKSPLSRLNESNELNEFSESIIIIDDSISEPTTMLTKVEKKDVIVKDTFTNDPEESSDIKPIASTTFTGKIKDTKSVLEPSVNSISNRLETLHTVSPRHVDTSKIVTSNEEIVEIDCNDTLMEMEAYHNAFNQSTTNSQQTYPNFVDSVIVIDPDDDDDKDDTNSSMNTNNCPAQKTNVVAKPIEDCFVVWSSLPQPSTSTSTASSSTTGTHTFSANPLYNYNLDILKCDKILIDTNPEFHNLRLLNNENNKPKKNRLKSPKNVKGIKKTPLKTTDKGKTSVKNSVKGTSKLVNKTADSFLTRAAAKASTKVGSKATAKVATKTSAKTVAKSTAKSTATTAKKKSKGNGQLIFSSESKEDTENKTVKKKTMKGKLREIVIDGCNVAMAYNHNKIFSEKGIKLLIDYFKPRGYIVKVFIPQSRRSLKFPLLEKWFNDGIVVFTPSRKIGNKFITSYDDRYILEYATACGGIVVSQDQFRDLYAENPQYRDTIENRLLVPTFVGDYVMFPEDPLGRDGPSLTDFLKH